MPEHLAIGQNIQSGIVPFLALKISDVVFPTPFAITPSVDISVDANSISVPFRINVSPIGFTIKFSVNFTGNVEWKATKK